ncbi:MAG: hypothetical protein JW728_01490 [Candidatus Aureabacteria bacterium]|nr:hypothetical protein [Candidatus Auribacterota bacterium]
MRLRNKIKILNGFFSSVTGLVLFICFFLPSVKGCEGDIYPYKEFNLENIAAVDSARAFFDKVWQYALPYFGGLLTAWLNFRIVMKKGKSIGLERNLFMVLAFTVLSYVCCVMLGGIMGFFNRGITDFYDCVLACTGIAVIAFFLAAFIHTVLSRREDERKTGVYQAIFALIYVLWMSPYMINGAYYGMKISFWCMALLVVLGDVMYRSVPESRCRIKY